jgi:type II restriction enzyme
MVGTSKQMLGDWGEKLVRSKISCPRCKAKRKTLRQLPPNFTCADLICDFCGYLAQVKTATVANVTVLPNQILGAAWKPQSERMKSGIYFPLFIVLVTKRPKGVAIYLLAADLQTEEMFVPRKPLSNKAKRSGWQGYMIDLRLASGSPTKLSV